MFSLVNVSVEFGTIAALANASISFDRGEIHTIIGEHGAGKSTLARVAAGFVAPVSGIITVDGERYSRLTVETARRLGIAIVHQHNPFFADLTVEEYFFLNKPSHNSFVLDKKRQHATILDLFESRGVGLDPRVRLQDLKPADRVLIDILRSTHVPPRVLLLDESLEWLTTENFQRVLRTLKLLREGGTTIVVITHKIDYIYDLADRVSVVRDGAILLTEKTSQIDKINLVQLAYTNIANENTYDHNFFRLVKYDEAILKRLPLSLFVIDNGKRIRIINDSVKNLFGLPARRLLEKSIDSVFSHEHALLDLINSSVEKREARSAFSVPIRVNGRSLLGKVNTTPVFDADVFIGLIILIEDVTEHEQLRQQLLLSQSLASVGLLAAGVAHEINNPLDIMGHHLEDLKFRSSDKGSQESIRGITEEIRSISDIVGNLITFSDRSEVHTEDFDFVSLLTRLLRLVAPTSRRQRIHVAFENEFLSLTVNANKTEMKQIVLNLIRNSFEAMPKGGELHIVVRLHEKTEGRFQMLIRDSGCGITGNSQDIFLPFYTTKKGHSENMGLGLSVIYGIIRKHDGRIEARNLEKGCEFTVSLPYVTAERRRGQRQRT